MKNLFLIVLLSLSSIVSLYADSDSNLISKHYYNINIKPSETDNPFKILLLENKVKEDSFFEKYVAHIITLLVFILGFLKLSYNSKKNTEKILYSKKLDKAEEFLNTFLEYFFTLKKELNSSMLIKIKDKQYFSEEHHKLSLKLLFMLNKNIDIEKRLIDEIAELDNVNSTNYKEWKSRVFELGKKVYNIKSK